MKNLSNMKFGQLTVIRLDGKDKYGHARWLCQCSCGNQKTITGNSLTSGKTRSCGCLDRERHLTHPNRKKHGDSGKRLYRIWKKMKSRCTNPNDADYWKWYGGKGVKVCDDWFYNYWMFRNWSILNGYSDELSIDRINPYGNYEPSNCRWATAKEQAQNKRGGGSH